MKCIYCGTDIVSDVDEQVNVPIGKTEVVVGIHSRCKNNMVMDFAKKYLRDELRPAPVGAPSSSVNTNTVLTTPPSESE